MLWHVLGTFNEMTTEGQTYRVLRMITSASGESRFEAAKDAKYQLSKPGRNGYLLNWEIGGHIVWEQFDFPGLGFGPGVYVAAVVLQEAFVDDNDQHWVGTVRTIATTGAKNSDDAVKQFTNELPGMAYSLWVATGSLVYKLPEKE